VSISAWLKRAFRGQGRFDPSVGARRIPAATIRAFTHSDLDACRQLYLLNQPGRFSVRYLDLFVESLELPSHLYLIVEWQGQIAAVGGIYLTPEVPSGCTLVFGLVDPSCHRKGIGTALLLARLSVLRKPAGVWWAFLSSAGGSWTFFERFGFQHYGRFPIPPDMEYFDCYRSYLEEADWSRCATVLEEQRVHFDREGLQVPMGPAIPNQSPERTRGR
jgi:ribosomal protein S18 acetylase RimI-like enzyme